MKPPKKKKKKKKKAKTPAWLSILPGGLDPSRFTFEQLRDAKKAHGFLTERFDGPPGIGEYMRAYRFLLLLGIACVVEDRYPPLTRCWKDLEKLFMGDPAFADGIVVPSWILMDFPFGPKGETALDYFENFLAEADPAAWRSLDPLATERLARPIPLLSCPAVHIVEWRSDPARPDLGPTRANVAVLESGCREAMARHGELVRRLGLRVLRAGGSPDVPVSVLPRDDGARNMNDTRFRFRAASSESAPPSRILGFTRYVPLYVLVTFDGPAERVMAHEMFHALNWHYGVIEQGSGTWAEQLQQEEERAQQLTEMIGLGR